MRRALVVLVAVGLLAPAAAEGRPWLTMRRAERAALTYRDFDTAMLVDKIAVCERRRATVVICDIEGTERQPDPGGPVITLEGGSADTPGTELAVPVEVRLTRHGLRTTRR